MDAVQAAGGPKARLRQTINLARSLTPAELRDWLEERRFDYRGGFELMLFRKIAEERSARLEPGIHAEWDHRRGGYRMLQEWAERDPKRLLEFARTDPDDRRLDYSWSEMAKRHPETALQFLQESVLSGERDPSHIYTWMALREILHRSPAALENALETLPSPFRRKVEDIKLADALSTAAGPAMAELYARPDGWEAFRRALFDARDPAGILLGEVAALPSSWKAAVAADPRSTLRGASASRWAEANLEAAGFTPEQAEAIRQSWEK